MLQNLPVKKLLLLLFLLQSGKIFSQSKFTIEGTTNKVTNGRAVITGNKQLFPYNSKQDTVTITNHSFKFEGVLKYTEQHRIIILQGVKEVLLTEPFFVGSGHQQINIDTATEIHDVLDVGIGVILVGSEANNEYINKYLPIYDELSSHYSALYTARRKCSSIADKQARNGCFLQADKMKYIIRNSRDSILFNYVKSNPQSPILPAVLFAAITDHGYSPYFQTALTSMVNYIPLQTNTYLSNFLTRQKLKAPGNLFPLNNFVKAKLGANYNKPKYTLVEFWYSSCIPCIAQFVQIKEIYQKFKSKGFEVVGIAVDTKDKLVNLKNVIKKNDYTWKHVSDMGGVKTRSMDVMMFPTSFLLDAEGRIIKMNMPVSLIDSFLEEKLL